MTATPSMDQMLWAITGNGFQLEIVKVDGGWSSNLGDWLSGKIASAEWQAALTVYQKYHRVLNLNHSHLIGLRNLTETFATKRMAEGKKAGVDILIQEASAMCKREHALNPMPIPGA